MAFKEYVKVIMKNLNFRKIFLVIISSTFILFDAHATEIHGGNVSGTWTLANSPYHINGEITIPNGETLTIEPGVEVVFSGHYKFNVQGRILAIGTEQDSIIFTAEDHSAGWHGLKFDNTPSSNDSSILEYCRLEYGKANTDSGDVNRCGGAIYAKCDKLRISHCLLQFNMCYHTDLTQTGGGAIAIRGKSIIEFCEFSQNTGVFAGAMLIWDDGSSPLINGNYYHHNSGHGTINIGSWSGNNTSPIFINNVIANNSSNGHGIIHFSNGGGLAVFINNTIVNNSCAGLSGSIFSNHNISSLFINNIIYGNTPAQVRLEASYALDFVNCLIEHGERGFSGTRSTGIYQNNIDNDPMFVDSANNDFRLLDVSPCIGAGADSVYLNNMWYYTPICDYKVNPRPNPINSMPDIGALENSLGQPLTGIKGNIEEIPKKYLLYQNYSNPFNPTTKISWQSPVSSRQVLKVFDVLGNEVATLVDEYKPAGSYELEFDGSKLTSGVYFYQLKAGNYVDTKKMVLMK
jgi:hypothetical protein